MIEITCDKCKKKVAVNAKTISAKTLNKHGFEAVSFDKVIIYHICLDCLEDLQTWVETPDFVMG